MRSMQIVIGDQKWKLKVLSNEDYAREHGGSTIAMTMRDYNLIHFVEDYVDMATIRHELFHAYMNQSCVYSANLSMQAMEEVCAEIMAKYLDEYQRNCMKVFKKIGNERTFD